MLWFLSTTLNSSKSYDCSAGNISGRLKKENFWCKEEKFSVSWELYHNMVKRGTEEI